MHLWDILMVQPDSPHDSTAGSQAWYPPPFMANPNQAPRTGTEEVNTSMEVAAFLKSTYQSATHPGKRANELF